MTGLFLDTSALVKLFVPERHSDAVRDGHEAAAALQELLGLDDGTTTVLQEVPWRGSYAPTGPPTDPTVYRLYEAIQVYGPALKELIHEEWGDGIMSAINFEVDISRRENEDGEDRVRIVMDGKFLPYAWVSGTD